MSSSLQTSGRLLLLAFVHAVAIDLTYFVSVGNPSPWDMAYSLVANSLFLFAVFTWLASWRIGALVLIPLLFGIDMASVYFAMAYKIPIDPGSLAFLLEADVSEAKEFIEGRLIGWIVLSVLVGSLAYVRLKRWALFIPARFALIAPLVVAILGFQQWQLPGKVNPDAHAGTVPALLTFAAAGYAIERTKLRFDTASRTNIAAIPGTAKGDDIAVVLIIGESARGDHFALNGYARPTTPELGSLGVISFRGASSCDVSTRISVPCMLTRATRADHADLQRETSVVSVFRANGFATAWFSNQRFLGSLDSMVYSFAAEAERTVFNRNPYATRKDADILPGVLQYLRTAPGRSLTVFHTAGSHWKYAHRYPPRYYQFRPGCFRGDTPPCPVAARTNDYDNSILYTDHLIAQIVRSVADRRALVLYVSDHGESLGEDGYYVHGNRSRPEQWGIGFLVWASPAYKADFPDRYRALASRSPGSVTQDNLFHTLLTCAGIRGVIVDRALAICP